uniref:Uncharacterized protein n=1 Tax=Magnetococcus massalia (strain MO-1) TaxID=451514 RepID=A0A1S7LEF4_MAGMO|nr:protein of unknown function [Candidatus Magnetococcus massalia]
MASPDSLCRIDLQASSGRYTHLNGDHQRVPIGAFKIGRIASGLEDGFLINDVTRDPRVHNHAWAKACGKKRELLLFLEQRAAKAVECPV